ncbi:MAG: hypothetical protein R6U65_07110 [Perlabentimonas sp.]
MKKIILISATALFFSCTDFVADVDHQNEWEVLESEKVVLHYRPWNFSQSPSPTANEAMAILNNQDLYYQAIQDSIKRHYNNRVLIYLYNKDEANNLIGTNAGGHAIPKFNTFYYTFLVGMNDFTDMYGVGNPYVGAHELVHVITHQTLGYPEIKLMSEGYAVWLDGSYGRYPIVDIMKHYRENEPNKVLTPNQLLYESTTDESIYYPNSGLFTKFLVHTYGLENINKLFIAPRDYFKEEFKTLTGVSWEEMVCEYSEYVKNL